MSNATVTAPGSPMLEADQVLAIAHADAKRAYRDLSAYRIQLALEDDGWLVDYEIKDPKLKVGGNQPPEILDPAIWSSIRKSATNA